MSALEHCTAYQFLDVASDTSLRNRLQKLCEREHLLGTLTLSPEGINLSLVGSPEGIRCLKQELLERSPYAGLHFRTSSVNQPPYSKLIVQERTSLLSVTLGRPVTEHQPAAHVEPEQLCNWLDENRPLRLLDARNAYEVNLGHFVGTHSLGIQQFRDFRAQAHKFVTNGDPVVTYCTGGIRCELASSWLKEQGHEEVWQLSGGILNYFEHCGGKHWQGDCFVFDDRLAVDSHLRATYPTLCRHCQKPMTATASRLCPECQDLCVGTD